jgi:hypothetical protein
VARDELLDDDAEDGDRRRHYGRGNLGHGPHGKLAGLEGEVCVLEERDLGAADYGGRAGATGAFV